MLRWKYFDTATVDEGERSFVVRRDSRLLSHAGLWRLRFGHSGGDVDGQHIIDWVADESAKGAGLEVFRYLMKQPRVLVSIGGTDIALELQRKMGFSELPEMRLYAIPVRPFRQFLSRRSGGLVKMFAKSIRNWGWKRGGRWVQPADWDCKRLVGANDCDDRVFEFRPRHYTIGIRSRKWLDYLMRCPAMNCSLYQLGKGGKALGYFLVNEVGGQARIVELAIASDEMSDWQAAYQAAMMEISKQESTIEIVVATSLPGLCDVFERLGLLKRQSISVLAHDAGSRLKGAPPLLLQLSDNDGCFLFSTAYPYLT
ncbi:MAG: hypothetical protein NTW74_17145 [Acidobacteria bacterium]|nr:hypothetical protein [Acidobacteriota bacterium]